MVSATRTIYPLVVLLPAKLRELHLKYSAPSRVLDPLPLMLAPLQAVPQVRSSKNRKPSVLAAMPDSLPVGAERVTLPPLTDTAWPFPLEEHPLAVPFR